MMRAFCRFCANSTASILLISLTILPVPAQAQPDSAVSIRIGYFNLAIVKAKYKPWLDAENLRREREADLRKLVEEGNVRLVNAQKTSSKEAVQEIAKQLQHEINATQAKYVAEVQSRTKEVNLNLANAAKSIAEKCGVDVVVDGVAVYGGSDLIIQDGVDLTAAMDSLLVSGTAAATSGKTARPITARLSYFDLRSLKSAEPSISESETLRVQAEQQLRKDVEEANARLQKLSAQRLPKAEIDALAGDLQKEINAKQKALVLFVQNSSAAGTQKITSAVASLSKQGKFEILLERDGVMYGIDKVVAAGPNVTENILAILQPGRLPATISSATRQTQPNGESPPASTQTSNASDKSNSNAIRDKWAVIIGISKFKDPGYNLMYSAKDAADFRDYLISDAKFSSDHVLTLVNEQATRANIMRAFGSKWLPNLVEPGDLVVIYISTHGTPSSLDSGGRNYIVAYDTDVNDLYATAVDMDELARRIKEIKSDRAVIVLDTCYSGAGIPGSRGLYRHDSFDANKIDVGHGQMVICASSPNERSWESKTCQNGVFTRHLIDSLRLSSNLDLRKAFDKCAQQVQWEVKRDRGYAQTPQLGGKWEGVPLILSLPATEPRKMSMDKFSDFGLPANDQIARNPAIRKENPIPASQSVSAVSRMKQGVSTIPNIAGHWVASYGAHYQFWQKGKEYGWKFPHEEGRGVISDDGQSVLCQWWGQRSGKDTAKLEYDSNGVVVRIVGANGVTLSRH